ncbi:MAG TPA: tetratricopeptide repeat protein [Steroidobacteraceae bacterium]
MRAYALQIINAYELGDIRAADLAIHSHLQLATQTGDPFDQWCSIAWQGMRWALEGRFDAALRCAENAANLTNRTQGIQSFDFNGPTVYLGHVLLNRLAQGEDISVEVVEEYRARYPEVTAWRTAPLYAFVCTRRVNEVRLELETIAKHDFLDFERNGTWLPGMAFVAEAIELVSDREKANKLYSLLLPHRALNVVIGLVWCLGSAERFLGLLAATLGRWDDAARHFEAALAMNSRMGSRPNIALTSYDYARLMPTVDREAHAKAIALTEEALRIARDIGMKRLAREAEELRQRLLKAAARTGVPAAPNSPLPQLTKEGEIWVLTCRGERMLLKDSKGLHYIAELLRHPGDELHVLELVRIMAPPPAEGVYDESLEARDAAFEAEIVDARARRAYKNRIAELTRDLRRAAAEGNPELATSLRQELTALREEKRRVLGLGDRPRRSGDAERARINVTRTIRLALAHILDVASSVGMHLARSIRTGEFCSYVPEGTAENSFVAPPLTAGSAPAPAPIP